MNLHVSVKVLVLVAISLFSNTEATEECNLFNFWQRVQTCGLQWWTGNDLSQHTKVTNKVSAMVKTVMDKLSPDSYASVNAGLQDQILAQSADPLAKIIESALIVEPYFIAYLADVIHGAELTADEFQAFGLPRELSTKEGLVKMVKGYFDLSCTLAGVKSFTKCINDWQVTSCSPADKPAFIREMLTALDSTYCDGEKADPDVIETFTKDLGSISKTLLKFYGIVKDSNSPYGFSISDDSIIMNPQALAGLNSKILTDCGFYISAMGSEFSGLLMVNSTVGAGVVIQNSKGLLKGYIQCSVESVKDYAPELVTESLLEKYSLLLERYGLSGISTKFVARKAPRETLSVFGDPHLSVYNNPKPVTCSALGWQTYLFNEFYSFNGYAEPAAAGSEASYVTKVKIDFMKKYGDVSYTSESGRKPNNKLTLGSTGAEVTETKSIKIKEVGDGVQITHAASGTVFAISKYRETYFISVRVGQDVLNLSYGMLVSGCPEPIKTTVSRRKRSTECDRACSAVDKKYMTTCLFDCQTTGDTEVGNITIGIRSLEQMVTKEDTVILQSLAESNVKTQDTDERNTSASLFSYPIMILICIMRLVYV